jgi:hypothetical protein
MTFVVLYAAMSAAFLYAVHYKITITDNERVGTPAHETGRPKYSHTKDCNKSACAEQGKITGYK